MVPPSADPARCLAHPLCCPPPAPPPQAVEALKALNVPYLVSLPLVFQTTEEWLDSELGVHPVQVALQVRPGAACGGGARWEDAPRS